LSGSASPEHVVPCVRVGEGDASRHPDRVPEAVLRGPQADGQERPPARLFLELPSVAKQVFLERVRASSDLLDHLLLVTRTRFLLDELDLDATSARVVDDLPD